MVLKGRGGILDPEKRRGEKRMSKILICDDEKDIVSALKIYLESEGYETLCAFSSLA